MLLVWKNQWQNMAKNKFPRGLSQRDGSWWIRIQRDGKRIQYPIGRVDQLSVNDASAILSKARLASWQHGVEAAKITTTPTQPHQNSSNGFGSLSSVVEDFLDRNGRVLGKLRPTTIRNARSIFSQPRCDAIRDMRVESLTPEVLRAWFDQELYKDPENAKALDNTRRFLFRIFGYAIEKYLINVNPLASSKNWGGEGYKPRKNRIEVTDKNEIGYFLAALICYEPSQKKKTYQTTKDLIIFWIFTGLRSKEARELKWKYVDFENQIISLPASLMKGKRDFQIPLNPILNTMLRNRWDTANNNKSYKSEGYVFTGKDGVNPIQNVRKSIDSLCQYAGIDKHISYHDIRRTNTDIFLEVEKDPHRRQLMRGHAPKNITEEYNIDKMPMIEFRRNMRKIQDLLSSRLPFYHASGTLNYNSETDNIEDNRLAPITLLEQMLYPRIWRDGDFKNNAVYDLEEKDWMTIPDDLAFNDYYKMIKIILDPQLVRNVKDGKYSNDEWLNMSEDGSFKVRIKGLMEDRIGILAILGFDVEKAKDEKAKDIVREAVFEVDITKYK